MIVFAHKEEQVRDRQTVLFEQLWSFYKRHLSYYSVRTNNVLETLRQSFPDNESYINKLLVLSPDEAMTFKNTGKKTVAEIMLIVQALSVFIQEFENNNNVSKDLPDNLDVLLPLIKADSERLSVKNRKCFISFLENNRNSLKTLYSTITDPSFIPIKIKNIEERSIIEITNFLQSIISFVESFSNEKDVEDAFKSFIYSKLSSLHVLEDYWEKIISIELSLGYFPIFTTINAYLSGLTSDSKNIIEKCIKIYLGQTLSTRDVVAAELNVTPERVRQKAYRILTKLTTLFNNLRSLGFVDFTPYSTKISHLNDEVNILEGTHFTLDFVNWVIGSVFKKERTVIGNVYKVLIPRSNNTDFLYVVPTELCPYMDFKTFMESIRIRLNQKRKEDIPVSLRVIISNLLKGRSTAAPYFSSIQRVCRALIYMYYSINTEDDTIIFKANSKKK